MCMSRMLPPYPPPPCLRPQLCAETAPWASLAREVTADGPRGSSAATPSQPGKHRSFILGLRLRHWNKTALFHFFFLFVHLNVYLELHFVKNLPFSFYSPVH